MSLKYSENRMPKNRLIILIVLISGFLMLAILLFNSRTWTISKNVYKDLLPEHIDMRINDLTLNQAGAEDRSINLKADSAQYNKAKDIFFLDNVEIKIFTENGNYNIKAKEGHYEPEKKLINLFGQVKSIDEEGRILKSEQLTFDMDQGFFQSPVEFTFTGADINLSGSSFTYNTVKKILIVAGRSNLILNGRL